MGIVWRQEIHLVIIVLSRSPDAYSMDAEKLSQQCAGQEELERAL
jgi:hypothetical protein